MAALAEPHDQATFWCSDPIACCSFPVLKVCYALIGSANIGPLLQSLLPSVESGSASAGEPIILVFFHRYAGRHKIRIDFVCEYPQRFVKLVNCRPRFTILLAVQHFGPHGVKKLKHLF
jgi:hypothetical protein